MRRGSTARLPVIVLAVALTVTAALSWAAYAVNSRNEDRLLSLQAKQAGSVLSVALPVVETPLASASEIAASSHGSPTAFESSMAQYVGPGRTFDAASLWQVDGTAVRLVASLGPAPKLASSPSEIESFFRRAAVSAKLSVIGLLTGSDPRLGYGFALPRGAPRYVAYGESPLPRDKRIPVSPGSAFSELRFALYLGGSPSTSTLVETNAARLPIAGRTTRVSVAFGDRSFTLVAASAGNLGGALSAWLPWIVVACGVLLAIAGAATAERLVRRREHAEGLVGEVDRLYGEQRTIAETLQRALLPDQLESIPGLETAARYVPGAGGVEIGGDWYDVIPVDGDQLLVVVGDVSGRGLGAARIMATLRHAARAYAADESDPGTILAKISRLLEVGRDGHFATALCALVGVDQHRCTIASAGHLTPFLLGGGVGRYLTPPVGPPLGVSSGVGYESMTLTIPSSATLVLFTDGLVERRGESIDVGLERLAAVIRAQGDEDLDLLLGTVVHDLTSYGSDDDTAMIGLRWQS